MPRAADRGIGARVSPPRFFRKAPATVGFVLHPLAYPVAAIVPFMILCIRKSVPIPGRQRKQQFRHKGNCPHTRIIPAFLCRANAI